MMMKKTLIGAIALVVVLGAGFAVLTRTSPGLDGSVPTDAALVNRGAYLSRLADCAACHTAVGGQMFAGGLAIASPIGTLYSTNITPDKTHGIGSYTLADFDRAVRQGVRQDGASLYPAMPYPSFARLSDADVKALYAYFRQGVAAQPDPNRDESIRWPLSMRWPLAAWRGLFAPRVSGGDAAPAAAAEGVVSVERGKYLVTGAGHCSACHTPRGYAMQEASLDETSSSFLSGGTVIDGWVVPSLRGEAVSGLGRWSEADIAAFLKSGRTDHAAVFGGMTDVVAWSTRYYEDTDLLSVAKYLKTLAPADKADVGFDTVPSAAASAVLTSAQGQLGARVYQQQCALCHRADGGGIARMFPPLAGNPVVASADPISVVKLVLEGGALPSGNEAPSTVAMPAYADRLSNEEVAAVATFVRSSWGNPARPAVTAKHVEEVRRGAMASTGAGAAGWMVMAPQPYGSGWTFSPESHAGKEPNLTR